MGLWPLLMLLNGPANATVAKAVDRATHPSNSITILTRNVLRHTDTFIDDLKALIRDTPRPSDRMAPTLDYLAHRNADIIAVQ